MTTKHTIIQGDSRQMSEVGNKSVHLIVTSPPYWQLKDYGTDTQIGFRPELLKLKNDLTVRLIGIKQNPQINGKATEYDRI